MLIKNQFAIDYSERFNARIWLIVGSQENAANMTTFDLQLASRAMNIYRVGSVPRQINVGQRTWPG